MSEFEISPTLLFSQLLCIHYVPRGSPTPHQPHQCQPLTPEERDLLRKHVEEMPHHPDSMTGRSAYEEQLKQWFTANGQDGRVTEETPFPLRPGSAMICSGECFQCGTEGTK
jgi:hypothetical protein